MPKLAIIHTHPVTVEPLRELAAELLPGWEVMNVVDDSILPQLRENGGDVGAIEERWTAYARFAAQGGAQCILNACSSIGELTDVARAQLDVPVVRIDEAMAEEAVRRGSRIAVVATVQTTLRPTTELLGRKAAEAGLQVELIPTLADGAFARLSAGDREGHDALLVETIVAAARDAEVVVLAQGSMARVLPLVPEPFRARCLTSPRLGMERVRECCQRISRAD